MTAAGDWVAVADKRPPLDTQVLVALRFGPGGAGRVCDVACYIGKQEDGAGRAVDRWILADVRLESKQISHWAPIMSVPETNDVVGTAVPGRPS